MPTNQAVWLPAKKAPAFELKSAPYTSPKENQILVKNVALAINPADWLIQKKGDMMYGWLKYPIVLGFDVAGEVVEVGKSVTRFKPGDRVLGFARGTDEQINSPAEGGFQEYTILSKDLASHIPSAMSFESAVVIPLGVTTASAGLFEKDQLNLQLPTLPIKPQNKTLIVWGGSTSVGLNAIQLGVAAGYEVFTTASPRNFDLVKSLGASKVFDYKSKTVVTDMIEAMKGKTAAGALALGDGAAEACMEILAKSNGNKFVAMATYPMRKEEPQSLVTLRNAYTFVSWVAAYKLKGQLKGVKSNFIFASSVGYNNIGKVIWEDFLPKALETGIYVPVPEPFVFGQGIEKIAEAVEYQQKGVSAKKVVVML